MTKDDFCGVMEKLKAYYKNADFNNAELQTLWFSHLETFRSDIVNEAVRQYAGINKYPPTIADIKNQCLKIQNDQNVFWRKIQEIYAEIHSCFPSNLWSDEDYKTFQLKIAECKFENECFARAERIRNEVWKMENFKKPFKEFITEWKQPKDR